MKYIKIIILLLCIIFLNSCAIKNDINLTINSDGSIIYKILLQMDKELLTNVSKINNSELKDENIDDLFLEDYVSSNINAPYLSGIPFNSVNDGNFYGNEYIYEIDDINNITSDKPVVIDISDYDNENKLLKEMKLFSKDKDVYTANFIFDLTIDDEENNYSNINYIGNMSVKLPTKVISSNASNISKDGKTLNWQFEYGKVNNVIFSFRLNNTSLYLGTISFVIDIVLLIIIIIVINYRKNKNER